MWSNRRAESLPWWALAIAVLIGLWLVVTFKLLGVVIAACTIALLAWSMRPRVLEIDAVVASIQLSCQDIEDVLTEFDNFCTGQDPRNVEDRVLLRPALLDRDSTDPQIAGFHEDYANNQRFLHRMPARLGAPLSLRQAQRLLDLTDERAEALRTSWLQARRAARLRQEGA